MFFLVEYHRTRGGVTITPYEDAGAAAQRQIELDESRTDMDIENAVIGADSIDELRITHKRYFMRGAVVVNDVVPAAQPAA